MVAQQEGPLAHGRRDVALSTARLKGEQGTGRPGRRRRARKRARKGGPTPTPTRFPGAMIETEDSCPQLKASEPLSAHTAPQDGQAGSSHTSDGPSEQQRISLIVVALGPRHEKKGAVASAAAAVMQQGHLVLMALGLALVIAPFAAAIEPCAGLFIKALPNFVPSPACEGLLTERRGVHVITLSAWAGFFVQNGFQVASFDANPRAKSLLRHTMLVGLAASIAIPVWYASAVSSPSTLQLAAYGELSVFLVSVAPFVSFAALRLARAKRRSLKRAAREIAHGVAVSAITAMLGYLTGLYVALSDQIPDGLAGVAMNGKVCRLARERMVKPL